MSPSTLKLPILYTLTATDWFQTDDKIVRLGAAYWAALKVTLRGRSMR
jgi:hypothetical protein